MLAKTFFTQGILHDDTLVLIDPVILRARVLGEALALGGFAGGLSSNKVLSLDDLSALFQRLYPQRTHTARVFDPHGQAYKRKAFCGVSCGM